MRLLVLFSGGRDSTCLLHSRLKDVVCALHVNYGLRGEESEADEAHCRAVCERLGVELHVHRAGPPDGNVQAWARAVRYAEAERLAAERDLLIAVGHTATDQAETVLYRFVTSPGRRALLGMEQRAGRIVRPLLGMTRAETGEYCRAHALTWREDTSNAMSARGRIRELLALHPAAERNVLATMATLRDEAAVLDDVVDAVLCEGGAPAGLTGSEPGWRTPPGGRGEGAGGEAPAGGRAGGEAPAGGRGEGAGGEAPSGARAGGEAPLGERAGAEGEVRRSRQGSPDEPGSPGLDLCALPPALARLVLQRLADDAGGPSIAAHADAVLALDRRGTATIDLPGGLRAVSEYGRVRIDRGASAQPAPAWLPVPGRVRYGAGEVTSERGAFAIADGTLSAPTLAEKLEVRPWREGDRMHPLGMRGTKSLQDLFTDRKIPRERRAQLPVVLSDGEIAWVPGVATGARFRVQDTSEPQVRLAWRQGAR